MRVALHTRVRADRIAQYEAAHREVPPELRAAICAAGATSWTIWRSGTELFHLIELRSPAERVGGIAGECGMAGSDERTARCRARLFERRRGGRASRGVGAVSGAGWVDAWRAGRGLR
ncbi:hypothetical protein GCM10010289_24040 [Streptomyces violascens]|uniref:L-rhamnose mutarotase n=1 Tax=Streptomyces violascens TaxID=67381 RepID=A0ABQ3QIG2_9ACTN|nr:hypothetical protein GCM10010289_24040 [Streptomyces violascens]GHI37069.1 hypothetical protein Sviol_14770 [Streptomyces violascens]